MLCGEKEIFVVKEGWGKVELKKISWVFLSEILFRGFIMLMIL